MADAPFDVVGVGNAIVDVIVQTDENHLNGLGLNKGTMTLIDDAKAEWLYKEIGAGVETSGGSAANTLAGISSLGGCGAYIGKVRNDQLGDIFISDIMGAGVNFPMRAATDGPSTARCLIFVTPDAERTMQTYLGASISLGPEDIDPEAIGSAQITYLEGYLFDRDEAQEAFVKAAELAHAAGRQVALTLSDSFCVDRHRASFRRLVEGHVDIVFANQDEITSLYQTVSFDEAVGRLVGKVDIAAITRGAKGSVIVTPDEVLEVAAEPVEKVLDTTGAGDLYAAGVLYGLTHGYELEKAAWLGSICAAEVISHYGARPEVSLKELAKEKMG
ncbi:MAG: 5-dehydro-2-deoxygluconokinase [Alphaproteobacteria bacterium MarineAlpha11_Bin1]|nr:MAG: 5-dehydro-2-deoxygluconokinase [Alphaproteobacteria bacterium MarineAlpha11_Bin1]|tara:strand:- start:1195 stop:2187 length:993 start_codon:yes stop_codon:yes gene_type:complete